MITSLESVCLLNMTKKQVKEFLLFCGFLSVTTTSLFCPYFSYTQVEGKNKTEKTKPMSLFNHDYDASKIFLPCLWLFLFHPLTIRSCLSFSCTQVGGNNKAGKTKAMVFFDHDENASKNILLFSVTLSLFHPHNLTFCLLWSLLKGKREATKFIVFTCIFSHKANRHFLYVLSLNNIANNNYFKEWEIQKNTKRGKWKLSIIYFILHKIIYPGKNIMFQYMHCIYRCFTPALQVTSINRFQLFFSYN